MANLRLSNITKKFGKNVLAVNNINLEVHDGEFIVLLGPSGCGKTTALRLLAGLEEITSGNIFIDKKDVTYLAPRKREVSMIFQSYAVWPHMKVYDNIAYPLRLKKMSQDQIDQIVKEVAEMADIKKYLDRYPNQLSGGQRQRVAVARAIAVKPKIFLMDEPLSNLDAKLRVSMRTELKTIHEKTNATTIFVTHDQAEAMSLADRIVIMKDGEIVQIGTPEEVYNECANMFVADFIGTPPTNFIEVEVIFKDDNYFLKNPDFSMKVNSEIASRLNAYKGQKIIIGIRPENIIITDKENSIMSVECLLTEPQGSHKILIARINDEIVKIVASAENQIKPREQFFITFKLEKILFFDYNTQLKI